MYIVAVANEKGGVAKTTTSSVVASILTERGYRVLVMDIDHQANLSGNVNLDSAPKGMYELLRKDAKLEEVIYHTEKFDCVPASRMLAALESELSETGGEQRLRDAFYESPHVNYDFVLIDCPPSFSKITANALVACDAVLIPFDAGKNAMIGVGSLNDFACNIRRYYNPKLKILGLLQTKDRPSYKLSGAIRTSAEQMSEKMGCKLFETRIRNCVSAGEAEFCNSDLLSYAPDSTVAVDYKAFVDEFLKEVKKN